MRPTNTCAGSSPGLLASTMRSNTRITAFWTGLSSDSGSDLIEGVNKCQDSSYECEHMRYE